MSDARSPQMDAPPKRTLTAAATLAAAVGMVPSVYFAWPQEPIPAVRLEADPPISDLGRVLPEQKYRVVFKLTNTGRFPVEIVSLESSCACTLASADPYRVQPGRSTQVQATFSTGKNIGSVGSRVAVVFRRQGGTEMYRKFVGIEAEIEPQRSERTAVASLSISKPSAKTRASR